MRQRTPRIRSRRVVTKYLLWPKTLPTSNGRYEETRWLERTSWWQRYGGRWVGWIDESWLSAFDERAAKEDPDFPWD